MAITHFLTQFTHVSRHFGVNSRKQKKWVGKTVLKKRFQICEKIAFTHKKMQKLRKIKTKNHESFYNLWRILGTKLLLLVDF